MRHFKAPSNRTTILVADDEMNLRLLVRTTLTFEAYTVLEAEDGRQAWELIQRHHPTLVLLDVGMPRWTGLEVARAIRADVATRDTRIVLLTAKAQADDIAAGLAAGADRYLTKPFSPMELSNTVHRLLEDRLLEDGRARR